MLSKKLMNKILASLIITDSITGKRIFPLAIIFPIDKINKDIKKLVPTTGMTVHALLQYPVDIPHFKALSEKEKEASKMIIIEEEGESE